MMKRALMKMWDQLYSWIEISRERRVLRRQITVLSKDTGISRATLEVEACRPFWDN